MSFRSKSHSFLTSWWNSIDRVSLFLLLTLMIFSAVMVTSASTAVAERINLDKFYFIKRQLIYLSLSFIVVISISFLSVENIRKLTYVGFIICVLAMVLVLINGIEIKGSRRWLYVFGLSIQPSEFIKPFFAVITGYILAKKYDTTHYPAFKLSTFLYCLILMLLVLQPDIGMLVIISSIWGVQLFLAGLSIIFIILMLIFAIFGLASAYFFLPHVTKRIDSFLDPEKAENYQIKKSLEAFHNGKFFGTGPGEGTVKQFLPDSHTDFIFSVIGEEMGAIMCIIVIGLFATIILRGFTRIMHENDLFVALATSGLLMQVGMQSVINMGVTLNLMPTKGMTLPFISYGGSSMIAISISAGIILAMTRKRYATLKIANRQYKIWVK